jgi:hypothetical protein
MQWTESKTFMCASLALLLNLACDEGKDIGTGTESGESGEAGDGDGDGGDGDGDGDTENGDGDGDGDTGDGDGDGVMCPEQFPSFSKACADTAACSIAYHTVNCCGTNAAIGIATTELAAFEEAEAICDSQLPMCDCAPFPTGTEDGQSTEDPNLITVECVEGSCMTSVLPMP